MLHEIRGKKIKKNSFNRNRFSHKSVKLNRKLNNKISKFQHAKLEVKSRISNFHLLSTAVNVTRN